MLIAYIDGSLLNSLSQKAHRETAQLFNKLNPGYLRDKERSLS
jgi:hypothetical protein